jgi:hypothetical protein
MLTAATGLFLEVTDSRRFLVDGDSFRSLRELTGRSQSELKELLNARLGRAYDKSRVSRWENGREPIPAEVAREMEALSDQRHRKAKVIALANQSPSRICSSTTEPT